MCEQACISRSARGAVWGVLTCLFVLSRYKGPKIFFACGALRIPRPNFYLFGAKSIRESFSSAWFGVSSRYRGPKIFFACGAPRIPLEISKETVFSLQCFSFGPGAVLGGAYMLVRQHACSRKRVVAPLRARWWDGFGPSSPDGGTGRRCARIHIQQVGAQ